MSQKWLCAKAFARWILHSQYTMSKKVIEIEILHTISLITQFSVPTVYTIHIEQEWGDQSMP